MVARTSVRLVWRFVQNRMGDMSSKIRMPSPEEALPGREQSMKVSGMALWICLTFSVHVLTRLSAVKTKAMSLRFKARWHGYSVIGYGIATEAYLCKRKLRRVLCGRGNEGLCFSWICATRMRSATLTSNRHFVYSSHTDSEYLQTLFTRICLLNDQLIDVLVRHLIVASLHLIQPFSLFYFHPFFTLKYYLGEAKMFSSNYYFFFYWVISPTLLALNIQYLSPQRQEYRVVKGNKTHTCSGTEQLTQALT